MGNGSWEGLWTKMDYSLGKYAALKAYYTVQFLNLKSHKDSFPV